MNPTTITFVVLFVCAFGAIEARPPKYELLAQTEFTAVAKSTPNDFCETCINFAGQAINQLLNIILNGGVVGTCGALCGKLPNKGLGEVCDILCDIVGIEEFIKIIQRADLDPIWYCELLKACPINDNGDAKITSFTVSPTSGPQGTTFDIQILFTSNNGTGTGEFELEIDAVDGLPLGTSDYLPASKAGNYQIKASVKASPDPSCDPTQGPCEQWLPGVYVVKTAICNGECGSKHPHSKIYSEATTNFTLTQ